MPLLTRLVKTINFIVLLVVIILIISAIPVIISGSKDLNSIHHPPSVKVLDVGKTFLHLYSVENKDILFNFYNTEFKNEGWSYLKEEEDIEYKTSVINSLITTGRILHCYYYSQGDVMLNLKFLRDAQDGVYLNEFYIEIQPKQR